MWNINGEVWAQGYFQLLIGSRIGKIMLAADGKDGVAYHEVFHAAYAMVLNDTEKEYMQKWANKNNTYKIDNEEFLAESYLLWLKEKNKIKNHPLGEIFLKIASFASNFINKVIPSFNNYYTLFERIESDEVWERNGEKSVSKDGNTSYKVTNDKITGDTLIPVVDVTGQPKVNVNSNAAKVEIAKSLIGKTFRIIGSDGIGRVASTGNGKHLINSSNVRRRNSLDRRTALSAIEDILNNAVYVEKHNDVRHDSDTHYIELYAVARSGKGVTRFRIVAKEGDKTADEYEVKDAKFYDIIKDGKLHANTFENVLPAIIPNGMKGQVMGNVPSSAVRVADLLKGVKDREGNFYVNKDGSLNYEDNILNSAFYPLIYRHQLFCSHRRRKISSRMARFTE